MDGRQESRIEAAKKLQQQGAGDKPKKDRHGQRLEALYRESLEIENPLRRNTRFAIAELLDVGSHLTDAIKAGFCGPVRGPKELGKNMLRALGSLGAIHRAASRYAMLDRQLEQSGESDSTTESHAPSHDDEVGES